MSEIKMKPIEPNPSDVAYLRKKLKDLVRRMQADYERELKPLIKKMGEESRVKAEETIKEVQLKQDSVSFLTAYEAAARLGVLKRQIVLACQQGELQGAIQQKIANRMEWIIPEEAVEQYGIKIGRIDPDKTLFEEFQKRLKKLQDKYNSLLNQYQNVAKNFTQRMYREAKKKFLKQFEKQTGIDILKQLSESGLEDAFNKEVAVNVQMISSIPSSYFKRIEEMVVSSTTGGKQFEGGLIKAIQDMTGATRNKAKLIARDQSAKAVSTFSRLRYENLGSTQYIWRNARDKRVAGNPNGLYPDPDPNSKYHGNHWDREGKVFDWDDPPPDGHPGMAINCRCFAEPIFEEPE